MKTTVAQINTTPGDFRGNTDKIMSGIEKSCFNGPTDLVVFPELTICGYAVRDMMYNKSFVDDNLRHLKEVVQYSVGYPNLHVVVGYVDRNTKGSGKPFCNMAAVIKDGMIIATYQKQLLPFYDVFDEGRYFEAGDQPCVIDIKGYRCGIAICEDVWNDKGQDDYNHHDNPLSVYREMECDTIISLNSSPYHRGKPAIRRMMLRQITEGGAIENVIYANQYGAQDELVFDGNSMIVRKGCVDTLVNKTVIPRNLDDIALMSVDLKENGYRNQSFPVEEHDHLAMTLLGLHDYVRKIGVKQVVVGSSGGIDSAVVIALAAMSLGPENVHAIKMPSVFSSEHSVVDAVKLHDALGVNDYTVKIDHEPWLGSMNNQLRLETIVGLHDQDGPDAGKAITRKIVDYNPVADENIQARMRGQVVMHFSNATGALPLTTGNKTELALGYCTLYGDMSGGFNPIGDLYKLEVYETAREINRYYGREVIPLDIINKAPSAELAEGQTDEASLLPYEFLDPIIQAYVEDYVSTWGEYFDWMNPKAPYGPMEKEINHRMAMWIRDSENKKKYDEMIRRVDLMEFKRRQAAPCTRLTKKAFGTGRRLPIVKK